LFSVHLSSLLSLPPRALLFLLLLSLQDIFHTAISLITTMITAPRLSTRSVRAALPAFRGQRQFSSARPSLKEIQEAYILSAARTPTAKVWKSCATI
jgi:hypothetical protein